MCLTAVCADPTSPGNVVSSKHTGGARYVVDLATMKQMNVASGFARDVKIIKPAAPETAAVYDTGSVQLLKELVTCKKDILSLKNILLKLKVDVLALKLQLAKENAKRIGTDHVAIAHKFLSARGPASSNVSPDPMCEGHAGCDVWDQDYLKVEYLSDDESEDDLLCSDYF